MRRSLLREVETCESGGRSLSLQNMHPVKRIKNLLASFIYLFILCVYCEYYKTQYKKIKGKESSGHFHRKTVEAFRNV